MGFLISKEFPTRFLSGDEVGTKTSDLIIKEVRKEKARNPKTMKEENVLVVYFDGKDRGVLLGKERAMELKSITGSDDTDKWKGKTVRIHTKTKRIKGETKNILHFRVADNSEDVLSEVAGIFPDDVNVDKAEVSETSSPF